MSNIYIYKIPYKDYDNLVKILNSGDAWRTLGGCYLGYSTVALDNFALPGNLEKIALLCL